MASLFFAVVVFLVFLAAIKIIIHAIKSLIRGTVRVAMEEVRSQQSDGLEHAAKHSEANVADCEQSIFEEMVERRKRRK